MDRIVLALLGLLFATSHGEARSANPAGMIWYLLYPFRGTTSPPDLAPQHPTRRAFTRYGNYAARHPVITLLISVAVGTILIYPVFFLYTTNFTSGASNLPHHVWTAAEPLENDGASVDVAMRSIWVHGDFMKALETNVLLDALEIQDELLGSTINFNPKKAAQWSEELDQPGWNTYKRDSIHACHGVSNQAWFFHSPLQYWGCSREAIAADKDIIQTVNEKSKISTSVNVTLRHSIVFAGKRFEDQRLVAADTLVVTLIHKLDSPVGREWDSRAQGLVDKAKGRWHLYPSDGHATNSQLYEFRFQPMSLQDVLLLAAAASLAVLYFIVVLSKLRAVKSHFGLLITVLTQIVMSILSSFTICAILKIDLSKIPLEAYPLVIFTIGLENMLRSIDAVLVTSSEHSTPSRISEALGRTGHIAVAGVLQNLFILYMLSRVVSPGVSAFCIFAGFAVLFDFFYLLTFFIAVLSVEVRRTELSDSLTKAGRRQYPDAQGRPRTRTWVDSILLGESSLSTRIAGTTVMVCFVLIAQWHFFETEHPFRTLSRLVFPHQQASPRNGRTSLSVEVNQARTPTAWLRLQDHETAREVINIVKPNSYSYVARVYDPLVIVMNGADRSSTTQGVRRFLPAFYDFTNHQMTLFVVAVIVALAAVSLLMNYLLWDENLDDDDEGRDDDDPLVGVKVIAKGHALDVIMLASSPEGVLVSVGLDRMIMIWDMKNANNNYIVDTSNVQVFPVLSLALDNHARWLAILSAEGRIFLWDIRSRTWRTVFEIDVKKPQAMFFEQTATQDAESVPPLVVVRYSGVMSEIQLDKSMSKDLQICRSPLVCVQALIERVSTSPTRIVTASRHGCVHLVTHLDSGWVSEEFPSKAQGEKISFVLPLPSLNAFLSVEGDSVNFIDLKSRKLSHTFTTPNIKPDSLRYSCSKRLTARCGSLGVSSFSLSYTNMETGACIMTTYTAPHSPSVFCLCADHENSYEPCERLSNAIINTYEVKDPGTWESLDCSVIVGIRKQCQSPDPSDYSSGSDSSPLRRRKTSAALLRKKPRHATRDSSNGEWEMWHLQSNGEKVIVPLCPKLDTKMAKSRKTLDISDAQTLAVEPYSNLLISNLGPVCRMGKRTLAVAFGNTVKVVSVGNEMWDGGEEGEVAARESLNTIGRKRRALGVGGRKRSG